MSTGDTLLEVRDLELAYDGTVALDGARLLVREGEFVSVVGANGAGKTSLIRAIAGMLTPRGGQVSWRGTEITGRKPWQVCALGIAQVAEGRQLFAALSVAENLRLGATARRTGPAARAAAMRRVFALFPRLAERLTQRAGTLSGGEQQMLAIGRALLAEPVLLMLDEPSIGLSPAMTRTMFAAIRQLHAEGMTVLLVEQNVAESLALCDRAYVLENGRTTLEGSGAALLADDGVRRAFLGL